MKIKIFGIIGFLGAAGWLIAALFAFKDWKEFDSTSLIIIPVTLIATLSTIAYILLTGFGNLKTDEFKKTSNENKLLKIQIEQKKLRHELAALNNNQNSI